MTIKKKISIQVISGVVYDPSENHDGIDTDTPYAIYTETTDNDVSPPVVTNDMIEGHQDATGSLLEIENLHEQAGCDAVTKRQMMIDLVIDEGGFNGLPNDVEKNIAKHNISIDENLQSEKDALFNFILSNEVDLVDPQNPTTTEFSEAGVLYARYKSIQIAKKAGGYYDRVFNENSLSPELIRLAFIHCVDSQVKSFLDAIKIFLFDLTKIGWTGTIDGDNSIGIRDYINDYGNYTNNTGLWACDTNAPEGSSQETIDAYKMARRLAFDNHLFV